MSYDSSGSYLQTRVLTAPQHKLQLMLLEGALRHGRRAEQLLDQGHDAAAGEALLRSQEIIAELIAGLRPELAPELVRRAAGLYVFVHRSLVMAQFQRDGAKLRQALDVLELECETWRQVSQQLDGSPTATETTEHHVPRPAFLGKPAGEKAPELNFEA
jgi:flagellar protein FliS